MNEDSLKLKIYKFTKLTDQDIDEIEKIYKFWHRKEPTQETITNGLYIKDAVDFRALKKVNYEGQGIGRVFCLERGREKLAYVLSFDTLDFVGKREHYLKLLTPFVKADRSFIYNLIYLEHIAFVFHVGVAENHRQLDIGKKLLHRTMEFYVATEKIRLVASTLDSGQFGMIRKLEKERPNMVFLNQEFSEQNEFSKENKKEIRVRVAELIDLKTFRKKINESYLQGTYDFVIPMQLNIAIESVKRMLKETNLKVEILWTSFFHNVPELTGLNNINQFYHGFYQPIRESARGEWVEARQSQIQTLRDISDYLKKKHEDAPQGSGVASLIPSMEKEGFEFFFLNDDPEQHDFSHFATPKVYKLDDEDALRNWLISDEHYIEQENIRLLTSEEKRAWYRALSKYVKAKELKAYKETIASRYQEWKQWRDLLNLSSQEEQDLLKFQERVIAENDQRIPKFGDLVKKINNRPIISHEKQEQWREWFSLHKKLYESDTMLRTPAEIENLWWCHGVVPISFSQGISGVMFSFTCEKPTESSEGKVKIVAGLADIIANSLSRNMLNIVNKLYLNNFKTALSRFKTAALSARNLSHNVGSHVYSFLSQTSELTDIIWKNIDKEEIPANFSELEGLKQLTKFFDFTKVRMSLLADMATNEPVASTTEWLQDGLLKIFNEQEILKQYVTGNTDRTVSVNFYNLDVEQKIEKIEKNGETKLIKENYEDWVDRQENTDLQIQVPNGVLGKSAFLMIMVNYLRNSIKYAPYEQTGEIEITLSVKSAEKSKRLYSVVLHDNIERKLSDTQEIINLINDKFIHRDGLYDDEFRLVQEGLGFAEMVAAARYLRKRPFRNSWVVPNYKSHEFLRARFIKKEEGTKIGYLGVEFFLKRPRPLLIIDEFENWSNYHERAEYLNSIGIKVRFTSELEGWNLESFAHEIGVVLCDVMPKQLYSTRAFTPRIIAPQPADEWRIRLQQENDTDVLIAQVWECWMEVFRNKAKSQSPPAVLLITNSGRVESNLDQLLLYDNHSVYFKAENQQEKFFKDINFYEFFRDHTPTGLMVEHINETERLIEENENSQEIAREKTVVDRRILDRLEEELATLSRHYDKLHFLLEEAASTRVIIIDERIQQMMRKQIFGKELNLTRFNPFSYLEGMGIYIPNPEIDANPNFDDPTGFRHEEQKLIRYLSEILINDRADFIVIHIGLIETMLGKSSEFAIDEWIDAHLPESRTTEYVMISGRGKPMAIPKRFRYLPYNSISRAILEDCPSKYELCQNLYSSRTRS